jgi:hypothetical protein
MSYAKYIDTNWFKLLKHSLFSSPSDYTDIGHLNTEECTNYMWIWDKGNFDHREAIGDDRHEDVWDIVFGEVYSGRYDECKNMISIAVPPQLEKQRIPISFVYVSLKLERIRNDRRRNI